MGTGGMRCGAGRPPSHVKAEHCRRIDVRRWNREGLLAQGRSGIWQWTCSETGAQLAAIGYRSDGGTVTLNYSVNGEARVQAIGLGRTHCQYGGSRPWFHCPVRGERVAILFFRAGRFACRDCQRIAYASQSDDVCARTWRKQARLESRLGPNWQRPKGMHSTTYERLTSLLWDCEERRDTVLGAFLHRMLQREPGLKNDSLFRDIV